MSSKGVYIDEFDIGQIRKKFLEGSTDELHVICDFDRTLTYAANEGKSVPFLISVLRDRNMLSPGYADKAKALFTQYHPIEVDATLSHSEKSKYMLEWWTRHNKLLIESGLHRNDLERVVGEGNVKLRDGVPDFLKLLDSYHIPLLIFSASGLGDAIEMYLEKADCMYNNIYIITNTFDWDREGKAICAREPIIHPFNKNETVIRTDDDVYEVVNGRDNVLLIGDSMGDLSMAEGFRYSNIIKVGFLNGKEDELRAQYRDAFDMVIEGDGDFTAVVDLFKTLVK